MWKTYAWAVRWKAVGPIPWLSDGRPIPGPSGRKPIPGLSGGTLWSLFLGYKVKCIEAYTGCRDQWGLWPIHGFKVEYGEACAWAVRWKTVRSISGLSAAEARQMSFLRQKLSLKQSVVHPQRDDTWGLPYLEFLQWGLEKYNFKTNSGMDRGKSGTRRLQRREMDKRTGKSRAKTTQGQERDWDRSWDEERRKEEWIECLGPENSKRQVGKQSAKALARLVIFCIAVALSFILCTPSFF